MRPSEVRMRVMADHDELRGRLDRLERLALSVAAADDAPNDLREEAEAFLDRLAIHMGWEDLHLVPVLREADSWGEVRIERFDKEHREQRELLEYVLRELHDKGRPEAVVARKVLDFVALLRVDMEEEESVFLDERILRDDPVAIDLFAG
jgi:hemerythrin-like domain-containing protein